MASSVVSESLSLDAEFRKSILEFKSRMQDLDRRVDAEQHPQVGDAYHSEVLDAFEASQRACREFERRIGDDVDYLRTVQRQFRNDIAPLFCKSWIAQRAHSKPSGFAGDFEMLVKLYDRATPARGLGGYIDLCILELPLARAVRARLAAARHLLLAEIAARTGLVRILDVASGPCREYLAWPAMQQEVEVVAMDNDKLALEYVQQTVVPGLPPGMRLLPERYNALRTRSAEATRRNFGSFDIIYSVGLCDYLTDAHLVSLFSGWRETLNDDGALYIAFKDTEQYDKTPYQWHLDWFFYQRTESDVLSLYEQAGFDLRGMKTTRDETHIIINFLTRQDGSQIRRVDSAEVHAPLGQPASQPATADRNLAK